MLPSPKEHFRDVGFAASLLEASHLSALGSGALHRKVFGPTGQDLAESGWRRERCEGGGGLSWDLGFWGLS